MTNRYLPYVAIALLSFSLCLLGFLITSDVPHLGALMGLLAGGSLGILLLQVTRLDPKSSLDHQKNYNPQNLRELISELHSLSERVRKLEHRHNNHIDELKGQIHAIQAEENRFKNKVNRVEQELNICLEKLNKLGLKLDCVSEDITQQESSSSHASPGIHQWLKSNKAELISSYSGHKADDTLDKTAFFMGSNYRYLRDVIHKIRQSLSRDNFGFQVHLTGEVEQKISAVTNLGSRLRNLGFLRYNYNNRQKIANMRTLDSNGTQFLTGEWLERYVYQVVTEIFEQKSLDHEALMNTIIKREDGSKSEIDLLFFIKDKPLWIECKVANCEEFISKYSRLARFFHLTPQQMLLVVLDLPPEQAQILTDIHNVQVLTPDEVPHAIENSLQVFDGGQPLPRITSTPGVFSSGQDVQESARDYGLNSQENLQSFFNTTGLRPLPEYRIQLIQKLIERVSSQLKPQTASEIKNDLHADFNGNVSNSKISEFLKMCFKGGCLLNENYQPIKGFRTPVHHLVSQDWQDLEKKCVEALAYRVLTQDMNYFQSSDKCGHFQAVVGAAAPDPSRLAVLVEELNRSE
ncbi:DUF1887 family protein [Geitlerinema sp. P-1104]|uniref:Card1-like endonuclease domain-containing protein n=1 Tax=Geitlerinema sp. P-1104 TaxID=2546230 RepID=UPI00147713F8|nr:DUF1887 family CARF protein [Geitlerinema sp. P-1104]NMG57620.1 DUF1887 family protein [Geitlerinema sp. P-1104]